MTMMMTLGVDAHLGLVIAGLIDVAVSEESFVSFSELPFEIVATPIPNQSQTTALR